MRTRANVNVARTLSAETEDLVALVNGTAVAKEMLRTQQLADAAKALLTGKALEEDAAEAAARLINREFVWQEAQRAGSVVSRA